MKIFLSSLFLVSSHITFGQISFFDVLKLETKTYKDIQAQLLQKLTIIDDKKKYTYTPILACDPPEYAEDSCQWICTRSFPLYAKSYDLPLEPEFDTLPEFDILPVKNYDIRIELNSWFAENYNKDYKTAKTFIEVTNWVLSSNNNCLDEFKILSNSITLNIQFSDPEHWSRFKNDVGKNATFQDTHRISEGDPIKLHYGIRREQTEFGWKGVFISLHDEEFTSHATIYFNVLVD